MGEEKDILPEQVLLQNEVQIIEVEWIGGVEQDIFGMGKAAGV